MGRLVTITNAGAGANTPVGINGRSRQLPHNQEVAVSDAELEVLRNSSVTISEGDEVADPAEAVDYREVTDAEQSVAAAGPTDPTGTVVGADHLVRGPDPLAGVTFVVGPDADPTPAGADHLTPTVPGDEAAAIEQAQAAQQAVADGTIEPAVELTNVDPDQDQTDQSAGTRVSAEAGQTTSAGENPGAVTTQGNDQSADEVAAAPDAASPSSLNVEPFDVEGTLEQTVEQITQDMDEFTDEQIQQLLDGERAGKDRSTLIEKFERRLASA